jgi:tetratricopeptide (TPR) repeat protein
MNRNRLIFFYFCVQFTVIVSSVSGALANEDKRGRYMTSIEGVLRLPDNEIDLATAALVLSREWGANKTPAAYRGQIDDMAEEIQTRLDKKKLKADFRAIEVINNYLFDELKFKSLDTADNPEDLFLHRVLERKSGYCLSLSMLYLSIAERIGLPVYGVVVPGHFFVRYDDGQRQFNIETTSGGGIADDKHYIEKFNPPTGERSLYFKNLTQKQTLGCFFNNLGNCYTERGQLDYAYDYLTKAVLINPSLAEAHTNLGNVFLQLKRPNDAIDQYEASLTILGRDAINFNNMGNAYLQLGRFEQAKDLYLQSLDMKPDFIDAYRNLAQAYEGLGQPQKALAQMRAAVVLKPEDALNHLYLGQLYRKIGDAGNARHALEKALRTNSMLAGAYTELGYLDLEQKDYSAAMEQFEQALSFNRNDAATWFGLAMALNSLSRSDEEIAAYREVLKLEPSQAAALQNLGNAYLKQEKTEDAIQCYVGAIQQTPDNADLHHNLGVAYVRLKQYDKAIEAYKAALSLEPQNGSFHNGLAICYYLSGDKTSARKYALKARDLGIEVQKELLESR